MPLAIIATQNLPGRLPYDELRANAGQIVCLFLTLPPLGALCSYALANKRIRAQFMAGVTAPALIISTMILFNLTKKLQENKLITKDLTENSAAQKGTLVKLTKENESRDKNAIAELLNGTDPL